jgi:hypothetical protein
MRSFLFILVSMFWVGPASAQTRLMTPQRNPNPPMVRTPPSGLPGAGLTQPLTTRPLSDYPVIKRDADPTFADPTNRNPNLRKR